MEKIDIVRRNIRHLARKYDIERNDFEKEILKTNSLATGRYSYILSENGKSSLTLEEAGAICEYFNISISDLYNKNLSDNDE